MNPQQLKSVLGSGLLSFPLTDFDSEGNFHREGYVKRLEWLAPYGASALFAAGGTGEFFSLTGAEYPDIIKTAVDTCFGKVPIIAGAGGAAHLPGMLAAKTAVPVLGVPVQSKALKGMDSLLSIVQMPAGIPVATFAIGNAGASNAALFAAAMLAHDDADIAQNLEAFRRKQTDDVMAADDPRIA